MYKTTKDPPRVSGRPLQTRQSEGPWSVQPVHLAVNGWHMIGRRGAPVMQAAREGDPVG